VRTERFRGVLLSTLIAISLIVVLISVTSVAVKASPDTIFSDNFDTAVDAAARYRNWCAGNNLRVPPLENENWQALSTTTGGPKQGAGRLGLLESGASLRPWISTPGFATIGYRNIRISFVWTMELNNITRFGHFKAQWSTDNSTWTDIAGTRYGGPENDGNQKIISNVSVGSDANVGNKPALWIRWYNENNFGSGSRDKISFDNVVITGDPSPEYPPPDENTKYLDNLYDLRNPLYSQLHELQPVYSRRYLLTSWIDTGGDGELSPSDIIDITDEFGMVTWWHVDNVLITMLVENYYNPEQKMYIELDPHEFPLWKYMPVCTWWHEIWPVWSRWYHLSSWEYDSPPWGELSYCDIIDMTDENGVVSWWHVLDLKYDIIVSKLPTPEEYIKENMPDLGQHSVNWCWVGAAANSIKWYAHHGYPELLDDPSDSVLDDNYLQILPWNCLPWGCPAPEGGFLRLLHEIAIDGLYPGMPENEITPENTFCKPISNDNYFYGLQEFIDEQGASLRVHEIVDNNYFGGVGIPPEDGENVIYAAPTFDNYKRELERCQDVLLQLAVRNYSNENYAEEQLDHIVTGVSFYDAGPGNQWIGVSDPWTPRPGPDHNNLENRYTYDSLRVVSEDPFVVEYTVEVPGGGTMVVQVPVVKLIYISPVIPTIPWTGTATFSLVNIYTLKVDKNLDLNQGSKLVVKFYRYDNTTYENENVIETFVPPVHVEENENARHPGGTGVKEAKLVLTTDDTSNVISTIATWTTRKSHLIARISQIKSRWPFADASEKSALISEISVIKSQWPFAPS